DAGVGDHGDLIGLAAVAAGGVLAAALGSVVRAGLGSVIAAAGSVVLCASAGRQSQCHGQGQKQRQKFLHVLHFLLDIPHKFQNLSMISGHRSRRSPKAYRSSRRYALPTPLGPAFFMPMTASTTTVAR